MSEQNVIKQLTVVEVIEIPSWIRFVIDNKGSSKAITILGVQMRVIPSSMVNKYTENVTAFIPKRSRLLGHGEIVVKGLSTGEGTLGNKARPICPVRVLLIDSVPMLKVHSSAHYKRLVRQTELTILVVINMVWFVKSLTTFI
jgi:hypothetical protein